MNNVMFMLIFSGACGLIGIIFLIIGIVILNNVKKKEKNCTSKTVGKVVDVVRHENYSTNGGYSSSWHPVIEYNIGDLKYKKESIYGSAESKYAIGQDIEVCYNPKDNNEYYIKGDTLPKTLGTIFTIIGIGIMIIAVACALIF